jgi:hypothetical protein
MKERSIRRISCAVAVSIFSLAVMAQNRGSAQVSLVFAVLTDSIETKSATVGQEFVLQTMSDVVVDGEIVIPKGSKILGHVSQAVTKSKDRPESALAIVIDKAVKKEGNEIPLQAIIAAVAAPTDNSLSTDPTYGMLHSNEPKANGAGAGAASRSGELSASSKANATAAVGTADLKGPMDQPFSLKQDSQGAIGYEGISLSWGLASPPPFTVFTTKNKNLKLAAGTQTLLRMVPPRLPK